MKLHGKNLTSKCTTSDDSLTTFDETTVFSADGQSMQRKSLETYVFRYAWQKRCDGTWEFRWVP